MPPKRKQANNDDPAPAASSSTRSTRSATKNTTTGAASSGKTNTRKTITLRASTKGSAAAATTPSANDDGNETDSDAMEVIPPAKKARTKASSSDKAAAKPTKQAAGQRETRTEIDDTVPPTGRSSNINKYPPLEPSNPTPAINVVPTPTSSKPTNKTTKHEPFTSQRALELFNTYADDDDPTKIADHFERLCVDSSSPMDGPRPVILSWLLGAKNLGQVSQAEWVASTTSLKISYVSQLALAINDLEELLLHGKAPIKAAAKKDQDYDRTLYSSYESNPKAAFRNLYQFTFALAKPEQSRNIDMDTSVALWTVLLVPKYPIMSEVLSFITERGSYRATNKDLWTMMLEFCETVKPTLEDYEADGAWPTLLDDFVLWKKSHVGNGNGVVEITDTND